MPTLQQIASQIRDLATLKAPIKTGNLKNRLQQYNSPSIGGMVKPDNRNGFTITFDYAPQGAEYGMFWNDPTVAKNIKNAKTKNVPESINYADKAINSDIVASMLDLYLEEKIESAIVQPLSKAIDDTLK